MISALVGQSVNFSGSRALFLPLPLGEGWGEGKSEKTFVSNVRRS